MKIEIIYQDKDLLVVNKPCGISVYPGEKGGAKTLIEMLFGKFPELRDTGEKPRYGIIHRLDKDTSGILLVAKNNKALKFFQNRFKEKKVEKRYIALVVGKIKQNNGIIDTLIGRSKKNRLKQKIYFPFEPCAKGKRKAITKFKVLQRFKNWTLIEVIPITGRRHQIRVHLSSILHPIVGDKLYGFKNLKKFPRLFLHSSYLKIKMLNNKEREFKLLTLPEELVKFIKECGLSNEE